MTVVVQELLAEESKSNASEADGKKDELWLHVDQITVEINIGSWAVVEAENSKQDNGRFSNAI